MSIKYVKSGASGAADGSSWTDAYTTLKAAMEAAAAGDTIYVSHQHAETQASALTITSPGTAAAPQLVYCVNDGATPPTALATTATVTTTGTSAMTLLGFAYFYGITFNCGTGSASAMHLGLGGNAAAFGLKFEACALKLINAASTSRIGVGGTSVAATIVSGICELINTVVSFGHTSQLLAISVGRLIWKDTASAIAGTTPTTLLSVPQGSSGFAEISGVDLSALGSGKNIIAGSGAAPVRIYLRNCKLGASVTVKSGTIASQGGNEIFLENCNSGAVNYHMEHYKYQGSIVEETTIVKSSGASDGVTPISWKMISLSSGPNFHMPLASPPISIWNDAVGSSKTVTLEIVHDSLTNLKDDEVWLQIEYLSSSSVPTGTLATDRKADVFATAADQTTSSVTWTTTGLTNPNKQKLEVSFTPQMKGLIRARVMLAKANYTIYADPKLAVA